jgi:hypothetical protein
VFGVHAGVGTGRVENNDEGAREERSRPVSGFTPGISGGTAPLWLERAAASALTGSADLLAQSAWLDGTAARRASTSALSLTQESAGLDPLRRPFVLPDPASPPPRGGVRDRSIAAFQ